MIEALLVVVGLLGITCAVLVALWKGAELKLVQEQAAHKTTKAEAANVSAAIGLSESARTNEAARLEAVIAHLKQEIASLENDLSACESPDVVRDRLRKLLAPPPPAPAGLGTSPNGLVPFGGAAKS